MDRFILSEDSNHEFQYIGNTYKKLLTTKYHTFYICLTESDENAAVFMFNNDSVLISNNHLAASYLTEILENKLYTWAAPELLDACNPDRF